MDTLFATVCSGALWGAFMGAGLGTFSGIISMHRRPPPKTLHFKHPVTGHVVELDTYGLDDDAGVVHLLRRVHVALNADPSVRYAARKQFMVILARVRNFYNTLKLFTENPDVLKYKIKTRKCATIASQSITNFEPFIWDSTEIQEAMDCLGVVQTSIVNKMLGLDR